MTVNVLAAMGNLSAQLLLIVCIAFVFSRLPMARSAHARYVAWLVASLSPVALVAALFLPTRFDALLSIDLSPNANAVQDTSAAARIETPQETNTASFAPTAARTTPTPASARESATPPAPPTVYSPVAASVASRTQISLAAVALWAWAVGALATVAWNAAGAWRVRRLVSRARQFEASGDADLVTGAPVPVLVSEEANAPFCAGWFRQVVVIPNEIVGDADALKMILAHELSHVRRGDLRWNAIQRLIGLFLYFHPAFHFAVRGFRNAAEELSDLDAMKVGDRRAYANCLSNVAQSNLGLGPIAFGGRRNGLTQRIQRILTASSVPAMNRPKVAALVAAALSFVCVISAVQTVSPTREAAAQVSATVADMNLDKTVDNLVAIHTAIKAFRADHDGDYPDWLSDLVPTYLADAATLIDPNDRSRGRDFESPYLEERHRDPKLPCSYVYMRTSKGLTNWGLVFAQHGEWMPLVQSDYVASEIGRFRLLHNGRIIMTGGDWSSAYHIAGIAKEVSNLRVDEFTFKHPVDKPHRAAEKVTVPTRVLRDVEQIAADWKAQLGETPAMQKGEGVLRVWAWDIDGALATFGKAAELDPNDPYAIWYLARTHDEYAGHGSATTEKALEFYERLVSAKDYDSPVMKDAYWVLASKYREADRMDDARRVVNDAYAALQSGELELRAHEKSNMMWSLARVGQHEAAIKLGEEVLSERSNHAGTMAQLAKSHQALGNRKESDRYRRMGTDAYGLVGKPAPELTLTTLDGAPVGLAELAGKPALLYFIWGTGGTDYTTQSPAINALAKDLRGKGLQTYALSGASTSDEIERLGAPQAEHHPDVPMLANARGEQSVYGIAMYPTVVMLDAQGVVRHVYGGYFEGDDEAIRRDATALVQPPETQQPDIPTKRISGIVRDVEGNRTPGAKLYLYRFTETLSKRERLAETTANRQGEFDFGQHPISETADISNIGDRHFYQILAKADGYAQGFAEPPRNVVGDLPIEIEMEKSTTLTGTVMDENGEPMKGAQVFIRYLGVPYNLMNAAERSNPPLNNLTTFEPFVDAPEGFRLVTTTDAKGRYRFENVPRNRAGNLEARRAGYSARHINFDTRMEGEGTARLSRSATIVGRVQYGWTSNDEYAGGVRVQLQTADPPALRFKETRPGDERPQPQWFDVKTDSDGSYRIDGVAPGYVNLWAAAEGWTCVAWDSLPIKAGETVEADLFLIKGGIITGKVIDADTGESVVPGEMADVGLHGPSRPKSGSAIDHAVIQLDGTFRLRAAPGVNFPYLRPRGSWKVLGEPEHQPYQIVEIAQNETVELTFEVRRQQ